MGCRQAMGCEVKQICGRLCRNHKGTRRPPPPILMQHHSSNSISSGEVSTELQSSKKWQKLLLLEELGLNLSAEFFRPTSERYTASSSSGSCENLELMKPRRGMACSCIFRPKEFVWTYPFSLGEGTSYISLFCFMVAVLGSVHKKIDLRHTAWKLS